MGDLFFEVELVNFVLLNSSYGLFRQKSQQWEQYHYNKHGNVERHTSLPFGDS